MAGCPRREDDLVCPCCEPSVILQLPQSFAPHLKPRPKPIQPPPPAVCPVIVLFTRRPQEGRARCPQRAGGGRPVPQVSGTFLRSRRAGDSAPYPRPAWTSAVAER